MKPALMLLNAAVFIAAAPFFEGVMRKITARIQSRQGPPLHQPYLDLLKLFGKENMNSSRSVVFRIAPVLAFAAILSAAALLPSAGGMDVASGSADVVALIYLLTLGGFSVLIGALAGRNVFGAVGAGREMITMIMLEPVLAMTLIVGAVKAGGLGLSQAVNGVSRGYGVSYFLMLLVYLPALQAFVSKQPFDIPEAEVEILEGPYIEYSGPNYALFHYALMIKRMLYAWIFVACFLPFLKSGLVWLDSLIKLGGMLVVFVLISVVGATNPRYRMDQAVRYYAWLILFALISVGLAVKGL